MIKKKFALRLLKSVLGRSVLHYSSMSFHFVVLHFVVVLHFISRLLFHVTGAPPWLLRPVKVSTSTDSAPTTFDCVSFSFCRERYGFTWAFFTHRRFLSYAPSPTFLTQPAFIKAFLEAGSSSLKFAGLHTGCSKHRPDPSVCLIPSNTQDDSFLNSTIY